MRTYIYVKSNIKKFVFEMNKKCPSEIRFMSDGKKNEKKGGKNIYAFS